MSETDVILVDTPLVPDPDAGRELGPGEAELIADEAVRGSRLLVVQRAIEALDLDGTPGGAVQLACTFHAAPGTRFIWARVLLQLQTPDGIRILDLAPREIREADPVRFTIDGKGTIGVNYEIVEVGAEERVQKEFAVYHCSVKGSGASTAVARWDFAENPHRRDGLGHEHVLTLTVPVRGDVSGLLRVSARLLRPGLQRHLDAIRDMVLGQDEHRYPLTFAIPPTPPTTGLGHFLRLR